MVSGSIRGCPSVFAEFSRLEPDLLYSLACFVQCLFVFAKTLNHSLLLCCSTASSLPPPENSSGGPWQLFPDFQTISRLSMACHSKLRCSQWLRPLLLSNSSIWSIRFRPNSSCQPLLTAPWLTWNSFEATLVGIKEFVACECVKAARGCCCFMMFMHGGMEESRHGWMLIDGEDDKKIVSSQNEALPFAHLALCRGAIPMGVSLTAVADLEFDVGSLEATASALTLSEISSNEALHAELDAATAGLS